MKKTPAFHPEHLALPGYESVTRNLQAKKLVKLNNRLNRPFRTGLPADLKCGLERVTHPQWIKSMFISSPCLFQVRKTFYH